MSDRILIKDLLLRTIIGIKEEERHKRQDVLINLALHGEFTQAGRSDDIVDAINYRTVTKRVIQLVEDSHYFLVEKLANEIAGVCLEEAGVERVLVRLEKPGALRFARSVGVEIERTRASLNRVLISLGSNINPEYHLQEAVARLAKRCRLVAVSPAYRTRPVGRLDQPAFINGAVLVETRLEAKAFKEEVLRAIEDELGRVRTGDKSAPRTIDLDISFYGDAVFMMDGRHIPDPNVLKHGHVARPLADVAPKWRHPETGDTLQQIADDLGGEGLTLLPGLDLASKVPAGDRLRSHRGADADGP
jgi:dihydroneopterin aldolase/2-amino-4-hydroxy-6-hydroxymethyldihydropteridine diphosphokinase